MIIVNGWKPLTIITKSSILDVAAALDPPLGIVFKNFLRKSNQLINILMNKKRSLLFPVLDWPRDHSVEKISNKITSDSHQIYHIISSCSLMKCFDILVVMIFELRSKNFVFLVATN